MEDKYLKNDSQNIKRHLEDKIDYAITEAEAEFNNGAKPMSLEEAKRLLDEKYYG